MIHKVFVALLLCIPLGLFAQTEVKMVIKGDTLVGTIEKKGNPKDLVILISGSGPTDRNGNQPGLQTNCLKQLSDSLITNQLAVFRFDKRGIAGSKIKHFKERDLRFDHYVNDVNHWIDTLCKRYAFKKVVIIGHSEGSLIGMLAAQKSSKVVGYVSIAGAGRSIDEVLREQLKSMAPFLRDSMYRVIEIMKHGDTIAKVSPFINSIARPSVQPYMISWLKYNPAEEIKKLNIPIAIIQGDKDIQVSVKDAELLASAKPSARLNIIPFMSHVLKTIDNTDKEKQTMHYNSPNLGLNVNFIEKLRYYLKVTLN